MGRHGEKKFTSWTYEDKQGVKIEVPVTLVDKDKHSSSYHHGLDEGVKTYFRVRLSDPEVNEQDTDINRLRVTVFAKLKELVSIEWRNMLLVIVNSKRERLFEKKQKATTPDTKVDAENDLTLCWDRYQVAEHRGRKLSRRFNNYYKPFAGSVGLGEKPREVWGNANEGWPDDRKERAANRPYSRLRRHKNPEIVALIPDTPENRIALELIADNIELLYQKLSKLLNSKQIEQTLAKVAASGVLALPAPK